MLNRVKKFLPRDALKAIDFALFNSRMTYGITAWGHATSTKTLFTVQKRAIRLLNNKKRNSHTDPLFKQDKIMKIVKANLFSNDHDDS